MKYFDWNPEKNKWLQENRGVLFEFIADLITCKEYLDIKNNRPPYEHQQMYILEIENYIYCVPFVEDEEKIFLKTIFASRKETKKYLSNHDNDNNI